MTVSGYCTECKNTIEIGSEKEAATLETMSCKSQLSPDEYEIKFFVCPECRSIQTVQIDDSKTKELFKKCLFLMKCAKSYKSSKKKSKLKESFREADKELNERRLMLSVKYDGKEFIGLLGNKITYTAPIGKVESYESNM